MRFNTKLLAAGVSLAIAVGITGCNDDPQKINGTFVDDPVNGLQLRVNGGPIQLTGANGTDGGYQCDKGDTVEFGLGDDGADGFKISLGTSPCMAMTTPIDLVPGAADATDEQVRKFAQFLQSLNDGSTPGVLTIPQAVRDNANGVDTMARAGELASFGDGSACNDNGAAYANLLNDLAPGLANGLVGCQAAADNLASVIAEMNGDGGDEANNGDNAGDAGDEGGGGEAATFCPIGDPMNIDFEEGVGLASQVGDLELTFVNDGVDLKEGTVTNFTFSGSGFLFIDNEVVSEQPFICQEMAFEIHWFNEASGMLYSASFTQDGKFNEVNIGSVDENDEFSFLGQYTDEEGNFDDVMQTVPITQ